MRLLAKKTDAGLSTTAKFVLVSLADYHNDKTGKCYPSHATIAKDINTTRETVARNIKILVERGLISTENRNGGQNSKYVWFHLDQDDRKSQLNVTENHNGIVTENESIVTENHRHCDFQTKHCDGESHEQLNNITIEQTHNSQGSQSSEQSDGFERWWCVYPKKVNQKAAAREWKRLRPDADLLIADTENRKANDRRCLAGFIWNPENYLRDERWKEAIEPIRRSEAESATTLPRDDNQLEAFAVALGIHDLGKAPQHIMNMAQYRQFILEWVQRNSKIQQLNNQIRTPAT